MTRSCAQTIRSRHPHWRCRRRRKDATRWSSRTWAADLPVLLPADVPWLTWVTLPRVPRFTTAGPRNKLLLVDPNWRALAAEGGWPAGRVEIADWPDLQAVWAGQESTPGLLNHASDRAYGRSRSDASDFARPESDKIDPASDPGRFPGHHCRLEPAGAAGAACRLFKPPPALEFDQASSGAGPIASSRPETDAGHWLEQRREAFGVSADSLDSHLFLDGLIFPCYAQGIARILPGGRASTEIVRPRVVRCAGIRPPCGRRGHLISCDGERCRSLGRAGSRLAGFLRPSDISGRQASASPDA